MAFLCENISLNGEDAEQAGRRASPGKSLTIFRIPRWKISYEWFNFE